MCPAMQTPVLSPAVAEILVATNAKWSTPYVNFDHKSGQLEITEMTTRVNMRALCSAVMERFKAEAKTLPTIDVRVEFESLNTSSSCLLFDLFKFLGKAAQAGQQVNVLWVTSHDNIEMIETGMDFQEIYDLDFDFVTR